MAERSPIPPPRYWRREKAPDFPDREVSCRLTRFLFDYAGPKGVDPEALRIGVRAPPEHLLDPARRIDWSTFRRLMENLGKIWSDEEIEEFGHQAARSRWARPFGLVLRRFFPLRGIFQPGAQSRPGPGNILVTCVHEAPLEIAPNHYALELRMHEGYEPCREFFVAARGFLRAWPDVLGLSPAEVDMAELEEGARYDIRIAKSGGLLGQLRRAVTRNLVGRAAMPELQDALEFLQAGYVELQDHVLSRRRAEEALRESEDRFRRLTENARDMIDELDTQGRFLYVSPNHRQVTGHAPEDLLGKICFDLLDPEDVPQAVGSLGQLLQTNVVRPEIFRVRHRDGTELWFESTGNLVTTASGETRIVVVSRNVTEEKRAEAAQRRLEAQVRHSQKLESLGVLAGGIAHDFNNLLTPILGYVEQALEALDRDSSARDPLERVKSGALRAAELTNQLLIHAGESQFVMRRLDLSEVVREMVTLLETAAGRGTELRCDLASGLPRIECDAAQIRQIVMNLITNASEAMGERQGEIALRTGTLRADRDYLATTLPGTNVSEGLYVYLEVSDTGCGMDAPTRERMFDPFFTTKFSGRGLGLSTLLGIVDGHRGAVRVQTAPGRGTTIRVLFPARDRASASDSEGPSAPEERLEGTVLVVDDDGDVRDVTRWMLESIGLTVLLAEDGGKGVDLFCRQPDAFSLVLLDLSMPRINGWDVLREIRRLRPFVPVLVSSGHGQSVLADRTPADRLVFFIQKPFAREALIRKIREVVGAPKGRTSS